MASVQGVVDHYYSRSACASVPGSNRVRPCVRPLTPDSAFEIRTPCLKIIRLAGHTVPMDNAKGNIFLKFTFSPCERTYMYYNMINFSH